ncbi:hypothetical protein J5N97_014899 [Dioscorea zingiberensis]|uniref:Uncharacterized protein n=1 Tax=Dioscorea zingiberensis TaxID=325984 RepID=A0A9D5HJY4_9LILI|nr:hypothetical protein J5N97_014899 [Dioscorea zingiberensis]
MFEKDQWKSRSVTWVTNVGHIFGCDYRPVGLWWAKAWKNHSFDLAFPRRHCIRPSPALLHHRLLSSFIASFIREGDPRSKILSPVAFSVEHYRRWPTLRISSPLSATMELEWSRLGLLVMMLLEQYSPAL